MFDEFRDFKVYMEEIRCICEELGYEKDWSRGGCYMHLEVSEFIEALRGKGDPIEELGDVLFTVLAVAEYYNIDPIQAIKMNHKKLGERIEDGRRQT